MGRDLHESPEHARPPENARGRLIAIAVYLALSAGLYFVLAPMMSDQAHLQEQLAAGGIWGVFAYIVLYGAQMFVPWLPGSPLEIIGGATFGFWQTVILAIVTASSTGLVVVLGVRRLGLERIVARFPGLLESPWRLVKIIQRQPWSLAAVNILTGDVAYFVAGAARTPLGFTLLLLGVMRVPTVMIWTAVGAGLISAVVSQQLDFLVMGISTATIVFLMIGLAIARRHLPGWLERLETAANANNHAALSDEQRAASDGQSVGASGGSPGGFSPDGQEVGASDRQHATQMDTDGTDGHGF